MRDQNKIKQQNTTQNRQQTLFQRIFDNDIIIVEFLNKISYCIRTRVHDLHQNNEVFLFTHLYLVGI